MRIATAGLVTSVLLNVALRVYGATYSAWLT
jgi:hypothetical protein